jgi:CRP-like cAMP-binding protein
MLQRTPHPDPLARVPLFEGLTRRELALAAQLSTLVELPAGRVLAWEGDVGAEFFVVLDGAVDVIQRGNVVATRGPGSPLGEIALLGERPRTATLVASAPLRAVVANAREFRGIVDALPQVEARLQATMAQRLAA